MSGAARGKRRVKLHPRDLLLGPLYSAFFVYLVNRNRAFPQPVVELVPWFLLSTAVYYLLSALANLLRRTKGPA